jgi:Protein of unknown function (DUF3147)
MQWIIRFAVGGIIVSLFASLGDALKPKGFAGLFGAAPSVALATLALTVLSQGKGFAAMEARSMILGGVAFVLYGITCVYLMGVKRIKAGHAAMGALPVWALVALALWTVFLR